MGYLIDSIKEISRLHSHLNYEAIIYLEGGGVFYTEEGAVEASAGTIIVVPPNVAHYGEANRIYIQGNFNQVFNFSVPAIIEDNTEKEGSYFAKMIYKNRYENPDYISSLCNAFACFVMQSIKMDNPINMAIKEIVYEINENFYDSGINLRRILQNSGYAEDYIRAHFKKVLKKTPVEFLTSVRIRHACYLIDVYRNTLSLSQIAERCGFVDYIYFSRRFKQLMGVSPQKYKELL